MMFQLHNQWRIEKSKVYDHAIWQFMALSLKVHFKKGYKLVEK